MERLYTDLQNEFSTWISQLKNGDRMYVVEIDRKNASFINFNYTPTLERLYGINASDILYIHGRSMLGGNLIFGHNLTVDKFIERWAGDYSEEEQEMLIEAADGLSIIYKDVNRIINKNTNYWESIKNIKKIHIWGLSISEIDMPYINHIRTIVNDNTEWEFSWYQPKDIDRIKQIIKALQIRNYNLITLKDMTCRSYK